MTKVLIILTLLGCDDGVTQCDILHQPRKPFPSQEACQKAADDLLEWSRDQPYPTIVTQCATAEATMQFLKDVAPADQIAAAAKRLRQSSLVN